MNIEDKKFEHKSYGVIQISRVSCSSNVNLFGSSIRASHLIGLKICPAIRYRGLNRDSIMDKGVPYIEVFMSASQFTEAITSLNQGSGTPVTIDRINGIDIEEPPLENKILKFSDEFNDTMKELHKSNESVFKEVEVMLNGKVSNKLKKEVMDRITITSKRINNNFSFIETQFNSQVEKTKTEAKAEIEEFFLNRLQKTGLQLERNKVVLLPEEKKVSHE